MVEMSNRFKYGLIFALPVLVSLIIAIAFQLQCKEQIDYSSHVKILYVPLIIASLDNWIIFLLLCFALGGIIWPKDSHPVFAFGMSFGIIFPAFFSFFVGIEVHFSSERYINQVTSEKLNISTTFERFQTQNLLVSLNDTFQERKCCGLETFRIYCPNNKTIVAQGDDQHEVNMNKTFNITFDDYIHGKYKNIFKYSKYTLPDDQIFPYSCCKINVGTCVVNDTLDCKKGPREDGHINRGGCGVRILASLEPCINMLIPSCIFPWIFFIYAFIFSWINLREGQGLNCTQFGGVTKLSHVENSEIPHVDNSGIVPLLNESNASVKNKLLLDSSVASSKTSQQTSNQK